MASSSSSFYHKNCSKSQMCFFKILHIISTIPPAAASKQESFSINKGVGIDLNLGFSSIEESVVSESSVEIPNNNEAEEEEVEAEEGVEEEKSDDEVENKNNNNGVDDVETTSFRRNSSGNCLDLLIEAARVISEKKESESEEELRSRVVKKRKERWVVVDLYEDEVAEEREPVVRSKRGRNQALPYRFRDSVIEPFNRSSSRSQRLSSSSTPKRLLR